MDSENPKKLIIIGAGGHGKVVLDIASKMGYETIGFLDDITNQKSFMNLPVLGSIDKIKEYQNFCKFIIAIGSNHFRKELDQIYKVKWATLIHPTACIGIDVNIGDGTVIMANAVINPSSVIGKHCIINTGAIIEHDNQIENYTHISPNASLAGTVTVGECSQIGVGATVKNNIIITSDCIIGAGAVVVKDIQEKGTYIGVPAKKISNGREN